jgi:DNA polymerase III epsilon subunit-like protein
VDAVVAHNAHVDVGVLKRHLPRWDVPEVFDTLKLAKRLLPDQPGYRLGMLIQALGLTEGLPYDLTPQRAAYDALVTARLLVYLATMNEGRPLTLEALRGQSMGRSEHEAPSLF